MCEEEARDLLGRTPGKEEKPHCLWGRYIALVLFWGSYAAMLFILCRMTSINSAYIFLAGVLGFCICFFVTFLIIRSHVDSYKTGYLKDVEKIGAERLIKQMTSDKSRRFYNAFWLTIVMNDKKKKHAIVHLFHDDLLRFITYLKTKVPNVIVPVHEITLNDRTDWFLENTKRESRKSGSLFSSLLRIVRVLLYRKTG